MSDTENFNELLQMLQVKLGDNTINAQNIITVLRCAMEIVEITEIKGEAQKTLAIKLVRQLVVEAPITDEKEKLLLDIIDQDILGNTINLLVSASKGDLDINKVIEVGTTCCLSFLKK